MTENTAIVTQNSARADITSALATAQSTDLAMIRQKAMLLVESSFLPDAIDTWQKAAVIMMRGRELNVPDWTALQHISIVHGNPGVDGQLALALVLRSGLCEEYVILRSDTVSCTIRMKRKGQPGFDCTCTMEEASTLKTTQKKGGETQTVPLTESYGWKQQPKTHLFYFTAKQITKRLFADVLNGMTGNKNGDLAIEEPENEFVDAVYGDSEIGQTPDENPTPVFQEPPPEQVTEGEWIEHTDAFDDEFPPIGVVPKDSEPEVTIGSLSMDSLWRRSRMPVRSEFNRVIRAMKAAGKIKDNVTADQVVDAIKAWQAAQEFSEGKIGSVEP